MVYASSGPWNLCRPLGGSGSPVMGQNPFWLQGAFFFFWMGYNRVGILSVVWMCFRWLGFLLPNCGAEGQKPSGNPSQFALQGREFRRKGVINGLGLCPTTSSPQALSSVKGAWQCSLRKAVHCRHRLNLVAFQVPLQRKAH